MASISTCGLRGVSVRAAVLSVSCYIELMADHATRIAQEVIYLVTGEIVRHADDTFENLILSIKDLTL